MKLKKQKAAGSKEKIYFPRNFSPLQANFHIKFYYNAGIALFLVLLFMVNLSQALGAPNAGTILQEQRELQHERYDEGDIKDRDTPEASNKFKPSDVTVTVKKFVLEGEITVFTKAYLQKRLTPYIGKTLTIKELYAALSEIDNVYKKNGYFVVRVFFPKQDVSEGIIIIKIIEGKVDDSENGVSLKNETKQIKKKYALQIVKKIIRQGSVINKGNLERAILVLSDMPGIKAAASLQQGEKENSTRVIIETTESGRYNPHVAVDNSGSRYTGIYKTTAGVDVRGLSGYGDELKAIYTHSYGAGGLKYLSLEYSSAILYSGLRGGVKSYNLEYELGKEFESLNLTGSADNYAAYISYPLHRSMATSLFVKGSYDIVNLEDKSSGITTSKKSLKIFKASLYGNHSDQLLNGGYSSVNVTISKGDNNIKDKNVLAQDQAATGARSNGSFSKISFSASRVQKGSDRLFMTAALSGQYAGSNLDSSEKLQLGGAHGVRAYPAGEGSGDHGLKATFEGSYLITSSSRIGDVRAIGFYDWGRIKQYKDSYSIPLDAPLSYNLSGWGLGLKFGKSHEFDGAVTIATKTGTNPGADPLTGNDSDGSSSKTRIWFSFHHRF